MLVVNEDFFSCELEIQLCYVINVSLYQTNAASEKNSPHCGIESGLEETAPKGNNYSVMGVKWAGMKKQTCLVIPNSSYIHNLPYPKVKKIGQQRQPYLRVKIRILLQKLFHPIVHRIWRGRNCAKRQELFCYGCQMSRNEETNVTWTSKVPWANITLIQG